MLISEWKDLFHQKLVKRVDQFLEEHGDEYIRPNPLEPEDIQLARLREEMLRNLTYDEYDVKRGMKLAIELLPHTMNEEEWREVLVELEQMEGRVVDYFEKNADNTNAERPNITEIFGLSEKTYEHFENLLLSSLENKDYENSLYLSFATVALFPDQIIGWTVAGRSFDMLEDHNRAIEIFELIQKHFPEDYVSSIFCCRAHLMCGDKDKARQQIDRAEEILLKESNEQKEIWNPVISQLKEKL